MVNNQKKTISIYLSLFQKRQHYVLTKILVAGDRDAKKD